MKNDTCSQRGYHEAISWSHGFTDIRYWQAGNSCEWGHAICECGARKYMLKISEPNEFGDVPFGEPPDAWWPLSSTEISGLGGAVPRRVDEKD